MISLGYLAVSFTVVVSIRANRGSNPQISAMEVAK